ncbi:hypothetical protein KC19_12G000100 [Ceratodon purpureus]|uniref:Uncharacterized protein n=1 Tax=Ceratodon purpureus TaxID=3225 RepID=A0A8T0G4C5_CERPU|nr:hypothetical protein KC19_12G000100 [Ceratodon purpureus]
MAHAPAVASLHTRWLQIEEAYDDTDSDESDFSRLKELWFVEAFKLLENAPKEEHCWCTYGKIMDPLLEPFSFFFEQPQSDLHALWRRLCSELNACTKCVIAYHGSKERYSKTYHEAHVEPLLTVLQVLDEDRVATHLQTLMNIVREEKFDSRKHTMEVITVLFEVLMFPSLLEDAEVSERFAPFLLYVEETHDLALAKGPQYPGVYTLLVHSDQQVRRVAFTLVLSLEKIKDVQEMESIAPLLEKIMHCLEFEEFELGTSGVGQMNVNAGITQSSHVGKLRPRVRFKREALWRGLIKILERLQPAALEEGIVERYSVFVSIVLNRVSEYDDSVFYDVLKCLELLLSNLGYKFWLRTTFSAGVVRNTLVSQCFHSNLQRMHTSIFELFPPFLLSLETLQDEYERQRRRLLYFLLQQVPASKNFNLTMRWKARQVSFKIICSGYTMEPPLPPWECAHVWGPPLVETLKDPDMHDTFRPAAFDLIQTILAADTSALAAFSSKSEGLVHPWSHLLENGDIETGHELWDAPVVARDQEYWKILKKVSDTMSEGLEKWSCVPLLWIEVLGGVLAYPTSFYKSVLWAYSRIAIVDLPGDIKVLHPEVDSKVLRWESPRGYDDQSDSDACANVVPIQQHCLQLINTFKRYADGFLDRSSDVFHHLTMEPWFAEPLLLLLMNSNTDWKVVVQKVLSQSGASSSLESQLKLLCNGDISGSAVCDAVRHASRTLLNWPLENSERALSQLFFIGSKLLSLNEGAPATMENKSSVASRKICESVPVILWPLVGRTIVESKHLIGGRHELMLTRMFQLLPSVCKHMPISFRNALFGILNPKRNNVNWFHDLFALGILASKAVLRWWQNATFNVVENLVQSGGLSSALKDIISAFLMPGCPLEVGQQQRLKLLMESASASNPYTKDEYSWPVQDKSSTFVGSSGRGPRSTAEIIDLDSDDENAQDAPRQSKTIKVDPKTLDRDVIDLERLDHITSALSDVTVKDHKELVEDNRIGKEEGMEEDEDSGEEELDEEEMEEAEDPADSVPLASLFLKPQPTPSPRIVHPARRKPGGSKLTTLDKYVYKTPKPPTGRPVQRKRSNLQSRPRVLPSVFTNEGLSTLKQSGVFKEPVLAGKQPIVAEFVQKSKPQVLSNQDTLPRLPGHAARDKAVLRELVMDDDNNDFGKALNEAVRKKPERRQVMTLQMPGEQIRPGPVARPVPERAPPPKLDMWFRQILSMDYFSTVGLECLWTEDRHETAPLPSVPTKFPSVQEYKDIFKPLLLEEFKAQLVKSFGEISFDGNTCAVLRLMSLERVDDFQIGRFLADGGEDAVRNWKENDLLLLTRYRLEPKEPQSCHLLAKVDRKERGFKGTATTFLVKVCMPHGNSRLQNAKKHLLIRSKWHMTKVMNMVSQIREFQALSAVGNFPLLQTILGTSIPERHLPGKNGKAGLKGLTTDLGDRLRTDYNESQVSAIAAAVGKLDLAAEAHQLALVQGPPGTGKTRTIVGIVSALLAWELQSSKVSEKDNSRVSRNVRGGVSSSVAVARAWQDAALAAEISGGRENLSGLGKAKETTMTRGGSRKRRILVCAQSNGAVDELVGRLWKDGLYDKDGEFFRPSLVRVGNMNTVHPDSMDIFIDTVVEKRLAAERSATLVDGNRQQRIGLLRRKLEEVIESIEVLEASHAKRSGGDPLSRDVLSGQQDASEVVAVPENMNTELAKRVDRVVQEGDSAVQGKLNMLHGQRRRLYAELRDAEKEEKSIRDDEWAKRQEMRRTIIREADVVLTTLSGCGADVYHACMERFIPAKKFQPRKEVVEDDFFSAVVIDEAGQALEPATLIPLQLLKQTQARCVMVGDPKQLPATLLSTSLSRTNFETSMFERLQRAGYPVTMLNTQYRMHPEIRRFPSAHFYNNQLTDGLAEGSRKAPFHNEWCFAPYVFFDVVDGRQRIGSSNSLCNDAEADAALKICRVFQQRYPEDANSKSISVITPYNQQRLLLQDRFNRIFGSSKTFPIEFNTVDGYQGREVDIVIFSTVRALGEGNEGDITVRRSNKRIGFVGDVRRMNVALTRARFSLWIVGNATALQQDSHWAALISDAKARQLYFPVKDPFVFETGATAHLSRTTSLSPGSYLDKSKTNETSAGTTAEHIAIPKSSEMGRASSHLMERLGREHGVSEGREGVDLGVGGERRQIVNDARERSDCARNLGAERLPRRGGRPDSDAQTRRSGKSDSDIRTNHVGKTDLDKRTLEAARNDVTQDASSRSKRDVDSRTGRSGTESRGSQKMAEGRSSEKALTRTSVDGLSRKIGFVNDRADGVDELRRSLSKESETGLRKATGSAGRTTVANPDPGAFSLRARPEASYLDFTSGHFDKSSVTRATQNNPVDRVGRDRSSEERIERNRTSSHNRSGQSVAGSLSGVGFLNTGQRTGVRPDSLGSASASRDEGPRAQLGHMNRNPPDNTSYMKESEWELYMRKLQEGKQIVNNVQERSDCARNLGAERLPRRGGRPDSDAQTRRSGKSDSDIRTNHVGKTDLDKRTLEAAKRDADRSDDRRSAHPPPTKKQKVAGGSSSAARSSTRPSTVDDILSGLGSLSRSQVMGSKVIDESLSKHKTTRHF